MLRLGLVLRIAANWVNFVDIVASIQGITIRLKRGFLHQNGGTLDRGVVGIG
ncbi:hypothetical protein M5U04_20495 [Xenorhabdus sp. XENO-1]|uniref:hypothetical protein n=1 Tax=Xenorhabdus bovienii TaxID=40576 RepID=UPI0020CA5543|nr:hypothetical protein [Xenorhabdus bovienii]MCP9270386.1 hypothetical protein [Xenorhabdus bovienii subsp. africana]